MTTVLRRLSTVSLITATSAVLLSGVATAAPAAAAVDPSAYSVTDTISVPNAREAVAVSSTTNTVYVGTESSLVVINGATGAVTATVPAPAAVLTIDVNPVTNTVYAGTQGRGILVVNGQTNTVTATIALPTEAGLASYPPGIAVDPSTNTVYAGSWTKALSVIDGATNAIKATVPYRGAGDDGTTGSGAIAVDPTTHTVYALTQSNMNVIDGRTNTVTTTVPVEYGAFAFGTRRIVLDAQRHTIYAAGGTAVITVIDSATNTVTSTFPIPAAALPAVDPETHTLYVAMGYLPAVSVRDGATNAETEVARVTVSSLPTNSYAYAGGVAVNSTTHAVYVVVNHDAGGGEVVVINGPASPACPAVGGAIGAKYASLGGCTSPLGKATSAEVPVEGGAYTRFEGGDIYWSPATGAHVVKGAIATTWAALGAERSPLGFPTTDELTTPDGVGRYTHFQHGSIYWTPTTGAHEIYGAIGQTWAAQGYELSGFGYPTTGEIDFLFGRLSLFQRGFIYYSPATGVIPFHW